MLRDFKTPSFASMAKHAAVVGCLMFSGAAATSLPSPINRPWIGYGINIEPQPGGGTNPGPYTAAEASLDNSRIASIKPQIARLTWTTTGFDPTSQVGIYDWTTTWAKNSFVALDNLKARNIPVMTGWWDTPWNATSSDHSTVVADFLEYLIKAKGYTNIFAWDGINEPNHRDPTTYNNWKTEVANIKSAIAGKGLSVQILGPGTQDVSATTDWLKSAASQMAGNLGGYDIHYYPVTATGISNGDVGTQVKGFVSSVDSIDTSNKPFYIEELGWKYDWDSAEDAQPNVVTYSYGLNMADMGIQVVRAGASAPMAWRLSDLGSPHVWGMYNGTSGNTGLRPWSYSWTLLTHAFPKGSTLYAPTETTGVRTLVGSAGSGTSTRWSLAGVNQSSNETTITLNLPNASSHPIFTRYYYFDGNRVTDSNGFPAADGSVTATSGSDVTLVVPANSMVMLTNA